MRKAYQFRALLADIDLARILREQDPSTEAVVATVPPTVRVAHHTGLRFFIAVRHEILRDAERFGIPCCVDSFGSSPLARTLGGPIGHASAIGVEGWDIYYPSHPDPEDPRKAITQLVAAVRARRAELHTVEVFVV